MITVELTKADIEWAFAVGDERLETAKGDPRWDYDGRSGRATHRVGAVGELGFCRAIGIKWPARIGNYKEPDADPEWEIRWSKTGRLAKVTPNDADDRLVALTTGQPPEVTTIGYIRAGGAKRHYPLTDPGDRGWPAHFVPSRRLVPINPGFHAMHAYWFYRGRWACAYCDDDATDDPT